MDKLVNGISGTNRELADNKIKRQQLREKINQLRSPTLIAELNAFEEKKREIRETSIKLDSELGNVEIQVKTMLIPEKENVIKILKQHDKEVEGFKTEIKELTEHVANRDAQFKDLFNNRTKLSDEQSKKEARVYSLNDDVRKTEHKINTINLELARINAELGGLSKEFEQYEGVEVDKEKTDLQLTREINQFERMVENLGAGEPWGCEPQGA
jgi:chromosome segregation ATPase